MKPFLQRPRFGLSWTCLWSALLGALLLTVGIANWPSATLAAFGALYLFVSVLIWQELLIGLWIGCLVFGLVALLHTYRMIVDFHWKSVVYGFAFAQLCYDCWQGQRQLSRDDARRDKQPEVGELEMENEDSKPMISLALLQRRPKYLEDMVLTRVVEQAWGGTYAAGNSDDDGESDDDDQAPSPDAGGPSEDGFVVGENPLFVINSPLGMFLVHNMETPYWENKEEVVESIGELRLRKAVEDHTAWVAVDMLTPGDESPDMVQAYLQVARLLVALADEDTLAVIRPEVMDVNVWSDELAERLLTPGAYEDLAQSDTVPVIPIADDDPEMLAAIETARRRWPEFTAAFFEAGGNPASGEDSKFVVKARIEVGESVEFIWVDVIGLEPKYVHGTLANDPVDLGDLKYGSQVEFPIEDVYDWCYFRDERPVGLFSIEAMRKSEETSPDQ